MTIPPSRRARLKAVSVGGKTLYPFNHQIAALR